MGKRRGRGRWVGGRKEKNKLILKKKGSLQQARNCEVSFKERLVVIAVSSEPKS